MQIPLEVPRASKEKIEALLRDLMRLPGAAPPPSQKQPARAPVRESPAEPDSAALAGRPLTTIVSEQVFPNSPAPPTPPVPLELSDSDEELQAIARLGQQYLEGNPRRIKRVLNTYRYVKLVCHRRGQPTLLAEWQRKTIAWLVFCLAWPDFMSYAVDAAAQRKSLLEARNSHTGTKPSEEALRNELPLSAEDVIGLATSAGNFLVESSPS